MIFSFRFLNFYVLLSADSSLPLLISLFSLTLADIQASLTSFFFYLRAVFISTELGIPG